MIALSLALTAPGLRPQGAPVAPPPAEIAARFQSVNADGWTATYASPPDLDPEISPEVFTVTRAGFDGTGAATTFRETLTCMKRLRQPFPNQASLTADQVVLSDFIYAGDVVTGAANNSTRSPPRPVCQWLMPDMVRATGSVTARLAVAHMHARGGRPVAAVRFILTDGTNTVAQTVSSMSTITYAASGRTVPHFAHTFDLAGFAANVALTLDVIVCPWVGAAYQASVHGATPPTVSFAPTRVFNDVSYGTAYAYVDAVAGDNATGVASTDPAIAAAAPYATDRGAVLAIRAFNNASFGRDNASGGVVRLVEGVHTTASNGAAQHGTMGDLPVVFEAADPSRRATTVLRDAGSNTASPTRAVFRNLTIRRNATGTVNFITSAAGAGSANFTVFEACAFDDNGLGGFPAAWINAPGRVFMLDCTENAGGLCNASSTANKAVNHIGGTVSPGTASYNVVGAYSLNAVIAQSSHGTGNREASKGIFVGFSHLGRDSASGNTVSAGVATGPAGYAIVGCVIEDLDAGSAATVALWGDGNTSACENVILQMNTIVGERMNFLYQDVGTATVPKSASVRFCAIDFHNTKSDVFGANANLVGNWPAAFHVGFRANGFLRGGNNGSAFGTGSWIGEVRALGEVTGSTGTPLAAAFADPRAPGPGGGDYTPGAGSALPVIPAGLAPYPVDQRGRAVPDDGTARAGAVMAVG